MKQWYAQYDSLYSYRYTVYLSPAVTQSFSKKYSGLMIQTAILISLKHQMELKLSAYPMLSFKCQFDEQYVLYIKTVLSA